MTTDWQDFPAPAKLNLFLHVTGRRPDGYHLLQTAFTFIDLCDTLSVRVRDDGVIARHSDLSGVPPEADLIVRAARLLQQATGCRLGADLRLHKQIPMGGGLGGGSSDAATTLLALNHLWQCGLDRPALQALGLQLGADVPVFVFGHSAFAEGVGEVLQAIDVPGAWYLLLQPPVAVPTAEIFTAPDLTRNTEPIKITVFRDEAARRSLSNDLQRVACRLYPQVAEALDFLHQHAEAMMTGSGACVFARFDSKEAAETVKSKTPQGLQAWVVSGYNCHPLRKLLSSAE